MGNKVIGGYVCDRVVWFFCDKVEEVFVKCDELGEGVSMGSSESGVVGLE